MLYNLTYAIKFRSRLCRQHGREYDSIRVKKTAWQYSRSEWKVNNSVKLLRFWLCSCSWKVVYQPVFIPSVRKQKPSQIKDIFFLMSTGYHVMYLKSQSDNFGQFKIPLGIYAILLSYDGLPVKAKRPKNTNSTRQVFTFIWNGYRVQFKHNVMVSNSTFTIFSIDQMSRQWMFSILKPQI